MAVVLCQASDREGLRAANLTDGGLQVSATSRRSRQAVSWQVSNDGGTRDAPVNERMLTHLGMGTPVGLSAAASGQTLLHLGLVRPSHHRSRGPAQTGGSEAHA